MAEAEPSGVAQLRTLAQSVGHDFNNFFTGILGAISLAQQELPATSLARSRLEQAVLCTRRATLLARHLLSLSEAPRAPVSCESADVNEILLQGRRLLEMSLPSAAVLSYELAPNLPLAQVEAWDLQGICLSLMTNAGEALPGGVGVVSVRTGAEVGGGFQEPWKHRGVLGSGPSGSEGEKTLSGGRCSVWVEVADDGHGIPRELITRVREPFFTTRAGCRGLGLFYVHVTAEAVGGDVHIDSSQEGTRIRVLFPEARRQAERPSAKARVLT